MEETKLTLKTDFIRLQIDTDGESNPICNIILDDSQELSVTQYELMNLYNLIKDNMETIEKVFTEIESEEV